MNRKISLTIVLFVAVMGLLVSSQAFALSFTFSDQDLLGDVSWGTLTITPYDSNTLQFHYEAASAWDIPWSSQVTGFGFAFDDAKPTSVKNPRDKTFSDDEDRLDWLALNNLNAAQVSERIESTAQGQRITVIENANVPQFPSGPNRPLIATMGGLVGMGLAASYFVLLEILNRAIRRPVELQNRFNIVPIAVIPYMESAGQRMMRRTVRIVATVGVMIAVPLALWYVDTNYIPLEIVVQKGLSKLGFG